MTTLSKDEILAWAREAKVPTVVTNEVVIAFATLCRADLVAENENLRTVMMAAAVEISEHWDAHCDEEGYGPVNLLRRLENGYPERYGYGAATVVQLEKERDALRADAERMRWLDKNSTFMDVDQSAPTALPNVPVLASVSNRIWYHATDDTVSYPLSAVADAAMKRGEA